GLALPPPYIDFTAADLVNKLPAAISAYQSVMSGKLPRAQMPDTTDIFLDSALPLLSFVPAPGLSGREMLVQACHQCHTSRVAPTLSRARFDVDQLDTLSSAEKDLAIQRIHLPVGLAHHMPPHRFRDLSQGDIDAITAELKR